VRHRTAGPAPPANSTPIIAVEVNSGERVGPQPRAPLHEAEVTRTARKRSWQPRSSVCACGRHLVLDARAIAEENPAGAVGAALKRDGKN
jgi:hypothetical protein